MICILAGKVVQSIKDEFAYGSGMNPIALDAITKELSEARLQDNFCVDTWLSEQAEGNFGDLTRDVNLDGDRLTHTQIGINAGFAKSKFDHNIAGGCQFAVLLHGEKNILIVGGKSKTFNSGTDHIKTLAYLVNKLSEDHQIQKIGYSNLAAIKL
jgi:hypothetical protein